MDKLVKEHPSTTHILNKYRARQREIGEKPNTLLLICYCDGKNEYFGVQSLEQIFYALNTITNNYINIERIDYLRCAGTEPSSLGIKTGKSKIIKDALFVLCFGNGEAVYVPLRTPREGRRALELISFELDTVEYVFLAEQG